MSNSYVSELNRYYREISCGLICSSGEKKKFLAELKGNVCDFLENNPDASFEDIRNTFGTPAEIAESFKQQTDITAIKKKMSVKKMLLCAVLAMVVVWLIFVVLSLIDVHTEARGYIEEGILLICNTAQKGGAV